jgi:hypothetical protein
MILSLADLIILLGFKDLERHFSDLHIKYLKAKEKSAGHRPVFIPITINSRKEIV